MKKATLILFTLTFFALSIFAEKKEININKQSHQDDDYWEVNIHLDSTLLTPEAIQICLMSFDPTVKFKQNFFTTYYMERLKSAKNEKDKTIIVFSHIEVVWESLFDYVKGSEMLLLTRKSGMIVSETSNIGISKTKKWIVSSIFYINDKPYCFSIPIEVANGTKLDIKLTSANMTLMTDLCEL